MNILRLLARPMLASVFIYDGIDAIRNADQHVERLAPVRSSLEKVGVPPVVTSDLRMLARLTGAVTVVAGLGLATGRAPRACAATLAAINLPVTLINNPLSGEKTATEQKSWHGILQGAAVAGGLLLAIFDREGRPSAAWRYRNFQEQMERINEVRETERERLRS